MNISKQKDDIEPKRYINATSDSLLLDLFLYCFCHLAKSWNGNPFFVSFVSTSALEVTAPVASLYFSVAVLGSTGLCSTVVNEAILSYICIFYSNLYALTRNTRKRKNQLTSSSIFSYFNATSTSIYPDHIYECKSSSC